MTRRGYVPLGVEQSPFVFAAHLPGVTAAAEGFAIGMAKNRRIDSAWSSMLNVSGASPGSSASGGGGGDQYIIPIYVDGKKVDEIWLDTARRVVRTHGGDVQKVFGRRTS